MEQRGGGKIRVVGREGAGKSFVLLTLTSALNIEEFKIARI